MGMVFPVSTHNYELRYWLAAGGLNPGYLRRRATRPARSRPTCCCSVTPPPQMPATLEAGTISGYSVGEPWNQQAVIKGIGVPVVTDYEIWKNNPEKVFGLTADFVEQNPNTTLALTKALIRAAIWLDANDNANRAEAVEILAHPDYVGADAEVIANSMTGTFEYEKGDVREVPDFNVFFRYHATYPFYSDAVWYLTQMRRWGQIAEAKPDSWYDETARSVYRPDDLPGGGADAGRRGQGRGGRLPLGQRRLPRADRRVHRRRRATTAARPTPISRSSPSGSRATQRVTGTEVAGLMEAWR